MRRMKVVAAAVALLALVGACESKQTTGTIVGAGAGGLAGHWIGGFWGAAAGALIGGLLGNQVGKSMDSEDRARAEQASQTAMNRNATGQSTTWSNPNTGNSGSVTPTTNAYVAQSGETCREFQQTVAAGGSSDTAKGRACKQADGSWKVVN